MLSNNHGVDPKKIEYTRSNLLKLDVCYELDIFAQDRFARNKKSVEIKTQHESPSTWMGVLVALLSSAGKYVATLESSKEGA